MEKSMAHDYWVFIEKHGQEVLDVSLELCCEVRKLCDQAGERLIAVYVEPISSDSLDAIRECGADGFLAVSGTGFEYYSTEAYTALFTSLYEKYHPSAVFVGGTVNGRDFAPRFAARLGTGCTSDATELLYNADTGDIEFIEPAAGGKIMAVITIPELRPQVATIRPGTFRIVTADEERPLSVQKEEFSFDPDCIAAKLISFTETRLSSEYDLTDCEIIVCLGNGLKDESLPKYQELARRLGGKIACTRPLVDRGLFPSALQIGQTGVAVKPKLYIGFGISGAVNHVIGVHSDRFIAVNKDPEATIFNYCDIGIVGDMDEVCDRILERL